MEESVRKYLSSIGRKGAKSQARKLGSRLHSVRSRMGIKGGKARAAKYDREQLRAWGKRGGRPPKKHRPERKFSNRQALKAVRKMERENR
jgi:general stress protein YciG